MEQSQLHGVPPPRGGPLQAVLSVGLSAQPRCGAQLGGCRDGQGAGQYSECPSALYGGHRGVQLLDGEYQHGEYLHDGRSLGDEFRHGE